MLSLVVALLVTAGLAPFVRSLVLRHGFIDLPNHRSSHSMPTPRSGGIACLAGVVIAAVAAEVLGHEPSWVCLVAAVVLALVGLADDRFGLPARFRLLAQVCAGCLTGLALSGPWLALAGALVVPALVNAVNFMDGVNGITGLTMVVWGTTVLAVGVDVDSGALTGLGGATTGAALGFLPFNAPRASMFLGDVGSYLFGALAGTGLLLGWAEGAPMLVLTAPLAIYAADTAVTLVRRGARGERLTDAHREHVYQRLTSAAHLSHMLVSAYAAGLAALVTFAWYVAPGLGSALATLILLSLYFASPAMITGRLNGHRGAA